MGRAILLAALAIYAGWLLFAYEYHFLDGANLLFHEAGHVFFGLAGRVIGVLGGSLGQLVFPVACAVHFLSRGRPFDAALCGLWMGENFLYIAVYIDDAYTMMLPLVGGDIHDWNWLLTRWGLLHDCQTIARLVNLLGCGIILGSWGAAAWVALRDLRAPPRIAGRQAGPSQLEASR